MGITHSDRPNQKGISVESEQKPEKKVIKPTVVSSQSDSLSELYGLVPNPKKLIVGIVTTIVGKNDKKPLRQPARAVEPQVTEPETPVEVNMDSAEYFYKDLVQVSHLLEPTFLAVSNQNAQRAKVYLSEWKKAFDTSGSRVLKKKYNSLYVDDMLDTDPVQRLDKWLDELKGHGVSRYHDEYFEFTSQEDSSLFANGYGYPNGSRVKLLHSFWYMTEENGNKKLVAKGVINTDISGQ